MRGASGYRGRSSPSKVWNSPLLTDHLVVRTDDEQVSVATLIRYHHLYVLCFRDDVPDPGPHPISQQELRAACNPSNGWKVAAIEPDRTQTGYHNDGAPAWLATVKRI